MILLLTLTLSLNPSLGFTDSTLKSQHWAYQPLESAEVPMSSEAVRWAQSPIDLFIYKKLRAKHLQPANEARPEKLLRRVFLDLTGLPPTHDELESFLNDPSPEAYERVVDRLLSSAAFGERWASPWLDLARYADSNGYQRDGHRVIWPFRDWVIDSINRDQGFDDFTSYQLAGDLLPSADEDQLIATGFHRCTTVNLEAGVDREEDRVLQVIDRVNTTGITWLGTTLECAQCHDHKYDPFTQKEYYQLFAFFNNTEIETRAKGGAAREFAGPFFELMPTENESNKLSALRAQLQKNKNALQAQLKKIQSQAEPELQDLFKKLKGKKKVDKATQAAFQIEKKKRKPQHHKKIENFFKSHHPDSKKLIKEQNALEKKIAQALPPKTLVMREMEKKRKTQIFIRGDFLQTGETVEAQVPQALHAFPPETQLDRRGLAEWINSPKNPITPRVVVNRWWKEIFGRGIVTSPEDFGTQASPPSHPQLLDWLANEFLNSGRSRKHLLRLIVTSATYKQSSVFDAESKAQDPENVWLSRGPRYRLPAEILRDNALAISGLISLKQGGPPTKPVQPPDIWRVIGNVDNTYRISSGEDLYRRGIYVVWRRSSPYPSFVNFDAPDRSSCAVSRPRTNTPLQALTLMNDSAFVEMAREFAARILLNDSLQTQEERIHWAFRTAASRRPNAHEFKILNEILNRELTLRKSRIQEANEALQMLRSKDLQALIRPKLTTWFAYCHLASLLLNLDETISKG